ncbi:Uncharacterised protein [Mycobacteroides abscessus subsp. abscessus]|nr:Uncharacterised protein [Mycobacteroides abscessus subsp. abscessus]
METTVNFVEWMNAIDAHPDLDGEHLVTAACIANGESVCTGCIMDEYGYEPCEEILSRPVDEGVSGDLRFA